MQKNTTVTSSKYVHITRTFHGQDLELYPEPRSRVLLLTLCVRLEIYIEERINSFYTGTVATRRARPILPAPCIRITTCITSLAHLVVCRAIRFNPNMICCCWLTFVLTLTVILPCSSLLTWCRSKFAGKLYASRRRNRRVIYRTCCYWRGRPLMAWAGERKFVCWLVGGG